MPGESIEIKHVLDIKHDLAVQLSREWQKYDDGINGLKKRWVEIAQYVQATDTGGTSNDGVGGHEFEPEDRNGFDHSTVIPKVTEIYDTLKSNLLETVLPDMDIIEFEGGATEDLDEERKVKIENYIATKNRLNGFEDANGQCIDDLLYHGNCFGIVGYKNVTHTNPKTQKVHIRYRGPYLESVSPWDIRFNPTAKSFEDTPKFRRIVKSLGELAKDAQTRPELQYSKEVLDLVKKRRLVLSSAKKEEIEKHSTLSFAGLGPAGEYFKSGYVEIIEVYGDIYIQNTGEYLPNHVVTIVDRDLILRAEPLRTWSGKPAIFHCGYRTRPGNLWAMGPLDNLIGMQYKINHLENARADLMDDMLYPIPIIRGDVKQIGSRGRGLAEKYIIHDDEGAVTFYTPDTAIFQADLQIDRTMQHMERMAGVSPVTRGMKTPGEQTSDEFNKLFDASMQIYTYAARRYEKQFLEKIVNAEIEIAYLELDTTDHIKVNGEDGLVEFQTITSEDLLSSGKLIVTGSSRFLAKTRLARELSGLYSTALQDQEVLQHFSSKEAAKLIAKEVLSNKVGSRLYEPYIRISERFESEQRLQAAKTELLAQANTQLEGEQQDG